MITKWKWLLLCFRPYFKLVDGVLDIVMYSCRYKIHYRNTKTGMNNDFVLYENKIFECSISHGHETPIAKRKFSHQLPSSHFVALHVINSFKYSRLSCKRPELLSHYTILNTYPHTFLSKHIILKPIQHVPYSSIEAFIWTMLQVQSKSGIAVLFPWHLRFLSASNNALKMLYLLVNLFILQFRTRAKGDVFSRIKLSYRFDEQAEMFLRGIK